MKACHLFAVALINSLAVATAQAQFLDSAQSNLLLPYTRCPLEGGLSLIATDHAPNLPMARPVDTAAGRKEVSVADGYRVMLAFPDSDPFVSLKIEVSMPGNYGSDKQAVLEGMASMSANSTGSTMELMRSVKHGIDVAALSRSNLEGGVISFYTFFDDKKNIVVTAYILNALPERRAFKDIAGFRSRRDRFVENYTKCMAAID
ncbi:MAG TPA: hypothetical protein VGJ20_28935 [Xanthobacteraceae bacterium]|jgi:hypothetical protein